jgi:4-hydroxy-tetrahydrodipicolinate reductase
VTSASRSERALRLGVFGASGRMGRAVVRLAYEMERFELALAVGAEAGTLAGVAASSIEVRSDLPSTMSPDVDVVIDFSSPAATVKLAAWTAARGVALVSGTTGLDARAQQNLADAAQHVPVLWEPNMSIGVHVLGELVRKATEQLGDDFDIEIVETHHRLKVDAPSGTALRLAELARSARAGVPTLTHGRAGRPGARPRDEIGMHAIRGGDVIGDHTVSFFGDGERIELTHRASSRDLFARGALRAAAFVAGKPAGRYELSEVVATRTA